MTLYERFLAWYPLSLLTLAIWPLAAYARAEVLAPQKRQIFATIAFVSAIMLFLVTLVVALAEIGGWYPYLFLLMLLPRLISLVIRRQRDLTGQPTISLDQHVAVLAFAPWREISEGQPSRALRLRTAGIFAGAALIAGGTYSLGWQLQPCAGLDRALQVSGCLRQLTLPQRWLDIAAASPDGSKLALAGDHEPGLYLVDPRTAQLIDGPPLPAGTVSSITWSPDSRQIVIVDRESTVGVVDVASHKQLWSRATGDSSEVSLAFSPDGSRLALIDQEAAPLILRASDGAELARLAEPPGTVNNLAFSPDGHWLAVVAWRGIVLYDLATGTILPNTLQDGIYVTWADDDTLLIKTMESVYAAKADATGLHIDPSAQPDQQIGGLPLPPLPDGRRLVISSHWSYHLQGNEITVQSFHDGTTLLRLRLANAHLASATLLPSGELLTVRNSVTDETSLLQIWSLSATP